VLLEQPERLLDGQLRVDREERRLGDVAQPRRARVAAGGDDLADERLPRDHAEEAAPVEDEDRAHLGRRQGLPRLLRGRVAVEGERLAHHCIADVLVRVRRRRQG
jgi:hypothetical protein